MNINFRKANIADYEDVNNYLCKLNDEHYKNMPDYFEKSEGTFYTLKKFKEVRLKDLFILILLNNENIGMVQIRYLDNSIAYLYAIYIEEKYREQGIGQIALQYTEDILRKNGWDILRLTVWDYNKAIHLYERNGYVLWEEKNDYCTELYKKLRD